MKVLGIITARGGSKGIPGKNLKLLAGKPLLAHTVDQLAGAGLDRVILSTEDAQIAAAGRSLGVEVPFIRPAELARDETPHLPVIQHAVKWIADHDNYRPDAVLILQPTSPLRSAGDISGAMRLLESSGADAVVSVSDVPAHFNPMRMLRVDAAGFATLFVSGEPVRKRINRRQDMPQAFVMNGAIYACRTSVLSGDQPSLYGDRVIAFPMPAVRAISIDTLEDWAEAEQALGAQPGAFKHNQ